jgi:hypothetical protein
MLVLEKYFVFYLKTLIGLCILFRCYNIHVLCGSVVEYNLHIYIHIYISHSVVQSGGSGFPP